MQFTKSATGAVKAPLEEFWSRAFTLSARLFGLDVVVEFKFDAIDLRPEAELEAFKQTRQMRILEQLSLGLITDEEASLAINGVLPPSTMKPLSGTMFKASAGAGANLPTDQGANPSNDGSTLNQNQKSDQPATGRGQNKKAEDEPVPVEAAEPIFVTPDITINVDNTQSQASVLKMKRDADGNLIVERVAQ